MSDEPRIVAAVMNAVGTSRVVAVPAATFQPTGRHIEGRDKCWSQVQEWAQLGQIGDLAGHPLNETFGAALKTAPLCQVRQLTCYRGVPFPESFVPGRTDMGPPPPSSAG